MYKTVIKEVTMIDLKKIGAVLKEKRQEKHITQAQMAEHLGLSKNHVSDIERGVHKLTVETFCGYCSLLHTTPDEVLEITDDSNILPELKNYLSNLSIDDQKKVLTISRLIK